MVRLVCPILIIQNFSKFTGSRFRMQSVFWLEEAIDSCDCCSQESWKEIALHLTNYLLKCNSMLSGWTRRSRTGFKPMYPTVIRTVNTRYRGDCHHFLSWPNTPSAPARNSVRRSLRRFLSFVVIEVSSADGGGCWTKRVNRYNDQTQMCGDCSPFGLRGTAIE